MKKILILGGGTSQCPLITAAKAERYCVVLCDGKENPLGKSLLDENDRFYLANTVDKPKIIEIAKNENIDGIISNSEFAMETVSAVVDELGLIGNSQKCIKLLQSKHAFRRFQKDIGVFCPNSIESDNYNVIKEKILELHFPVIVKPSECSGSRGIQILYEFNDDLLKKAFDECCEFSRNNRVTVEEYVKHDSLLTVGGDIFVYNGKVVWNGLASCIRYPERREVPGGKIWPIVESNERIDIVKRAFKKIIKEADIKFGELNVEGFFYENNFFVIEINVRQGGNAIPELIYEHSGIDMYKLLVTTCVGDDFYFNEVINEQSENNFITNYVVFSDANGVYESLDIDGSLKDFKYKIIETVYPGCQVHKGINAGDAVAMVRMKFPNRETQLNNVSNLHELIKVKLR